MLESPGTRSLTVPREAASWMGSVVPELAQLSCLLQATYQNVMVLPAQCAVNRRWPCQQRTARRCRCTAHICSCVHTHQLLLWVLSSCLEPTAIPAAVKRCVPAELPHVKHAPRSFQGLLRMPLRILCPPQDQVQIYTRVSGSKNHQCGSFKTVGFSSLGIIHALSNCYVFITTGQHDNFLLLLLSLLLGLLRHLQALHSQSHKISRAPMRLCRKP